MAYKLTLTENDLDTIGFVGGRYCWSDALSGLEAGENVIPEHAAWEIGDAFSRDTEGGHSPFPMLANGDLKEKLFQLWDSIV